MRTWAHSAWVRLHTIRLRLTLWYMALLAVILVAFSGFLYFNLSSNLHAELDRTLLGAAQELQEELEVKDGELRIGETPDQLQSGTLFALYNRSGQLVGSNASRLPPVDVAAALTQGTRSQQAFDSVRIGTDPWRVLTMPIAESRQIMGILLVADSEGEVEAALARLLLLLSISLPAILLLAVGGGLFLAGRALNPVDRITRTAAAISAEDLSSRLNIPETPDEIGRLAATFNQMLARLDRAFQRQQQFTADSSHELRTPLALLTAQIDLALERCRTPFEYKQFLLSMREDAARMRQLVGELLTLARADAGQEALCLEVIETGSLTEEVVEAMRPLAGERGVGLHLCEMTQCQVLGDQTRLMQLLVNLVDNALKYTDPGGSVTVSASAEDGWAIFQVQDTGVGVAPEHMPHLFERFYRIDRARSQAEGGAGLGLAICQWIVAIHGGTIEVASQVGIGTIITIRLPLAPTK
jgi:heavy metal sensor kinase